MDYLLPAISSFIIAFITIRFMKPVALKLGLVDLPNARKKHDGAIPLIGGVAIYLGVLMGSILFIEHSQAYKIYLISTAMILFLGVLDDKYDLSVRLRIFSQIIIASMMIFGAGFHLQSLGNIFGFFELNLGPLGILITIIAVIGAINAFNMVDGIDGLAGTLSLVSFSALVFLLGRVSSDWLLLPIMFIAALHAYLMFNLSGPTQIFSKIFMGDAGSMLIGLTVVWLLVIGTTLDPVSNLSAFRPVTALYLIAVPLMDMVAIMYRRIKKGISPFKPDREHLHHIFERAGYNRRQTLVIITLFAIVIAAIGCVAEVYQVPEWLMFTGFIILFAAYSWALTHVWKILLWVRKSK